MLINRLPSCFVLLWVIACPLVAAAQFSGGGRLFVSPVTASMCGDRYFFTGQDVRLTGSGLGSGSPIEVFYSYGGEPFAQLTTGSADSSGNVDVTVMIPLEVSTPGTGHFRVEGQDANGAVLLATLIEVTASPGADSDGDLVPDICDNCPDDSNADQQDTDRDSQGDVCDACPLDAGNDSDGDGLCSNDDACPFDANNDEDSDSICGDVDNCPTVANSSQLDADRNGIGDACQTNATCSDGIDNDGDSFVDFPDDAGCEDADDPTETDPALPCDDGIDNDADGLTDYRPGGVGDFGCGPDTSLAEDPECDDGIDNDGDGGVDWNGVFGVFTPDEECGGVGSTATEMPEPRMILGLALGMLLVFALRRYRGEPPRVSRR